MKNRIYVAGLFLIIIIITIFNLITGKSITLSMLTDEETGRIQLTYLEAISTIAYGFFKAYMWSDTNPLLNILGCLILCSPIWGLIATLFKNRKLQLIFALLLFCMHVISGLEVPFRIGLRHWNLGGAAAYAVFNLNYFVTFACTILIINLSVRKNIE